jgi:endonuclease YncB( thermonuclease family)
MQKVKQLAGLVLMLIVVGVWLWTEVWPQFAPAPALPAWEGPPESAEMAQVVRVIDGDTIDVEMGGERYRVRYIGIDSPERDEPYYAEATAFNRELVGRQTVWLVRDVSEVDRFGRLLRYIYLEDGTFVNAEMIAGGYARLVTFPPDVAMQAQFRALQTEAREARRGLWALAELHAVPGD